MAYHVFIERAQDSTPAAIQRVANAIAERYGLPAEAIAKRMATGRFRVKKDVDLATATKFAATIERLGALCTVVDASAAAAAATTSSSGLSAAMPATPAPTDKSAVARRPPAIPAAPTRTRPPAAGPRSPTGSGVAAATPPGSGSGASDSGAFESGLSAAFSPATGAQKLGALDTGSYQLRTLDGNAEAPVAPEAEPVAADDDPAVLDRFAPPESQGSNSDLELMLVTPVPPTVPKGMQPAPAAQRTTGAREIEAPDDVGFVPMQVEEHRLQSSSSAVHPAVPAVPRPSQLFVTASGAGQLPSDGVAEVVPPKPRPNPLKIAREQLVGNSHVRLAVGVLLALLLGFLPARLFWSSKVKAAQSSLNVAMEVHYDEARDDGDKWERLQEIVTAQRSVAESTLFNNRITAVIIWIGVGGLLGFAWFRKVPWDEL